MKPLSPTAVLFFLLIFVAPRLILSCEPTATDRLKNYNQLDLPGAVGPESISFDCNGKGPYIGVSDGRILKWEGPHFGWIEFAITSAKRNRTLCDGSTNPDTESMCGRPLGLKFNPATCYLYIADAYFGLLKVGPLGGVAKQLATAAEGVPFRFTNALDIDPTTGEVYLQTVAFCFKEGRLMKYEPLSKEVTVLLTGLAFPNGVALSNDRSFLLLAESSSYQILRLWVRGSKSRSAEVFSQLARPPDNIKKNGKGEFWVALNSGREVRVQGYRELPRERATTEGTEDPVAEKFDEEGKVIDVLDGKNGNALDSVSEVEEHNGHLWIGSAVKPYVGVIRARL